MVILPNKCKGSFWEESPLHLFFALFIIRIGRCNVAFAPSGTGCPAGSTPEAIVEGVAEMKRLLKYNDNTIADKLGFGRTTLWRMQKKSGAAKAKKEE